MAGPSPRSLTDEESALLDFVLGVKFPGVGAFREQARHAKAQRGDGPFLDFGLHLDRSLAEPAALPFDVPWVVRSSYVLPDGVPGGEYLVFQADGWLDEVGLVPAAPAAERPYPPGFSARLRLRAGHLRRP